MFQITLEFEMSGRLWDEEFDIVRKSSTVQVFGNCVCARVQF